VCSSDLLDHVRAVLRIVTTVLMPLMLDV